MAEETWEEKYKKEHKLRQEAETETILVKGIGMNSPEMKAAKQEIQRLKKELCEVRNDNRQLSHQIENQVDRLRKAALL
jgi:transposase-like protein|tara:strand:+ start:1296 stop:1532 length:237 start_codon:yes stop_codon:yes gene_type:complete